MRHITKQEQAKLDRERLSLFIRHIKHYKAMWGLPPDKVAFRNAWMAAKSNVEVPDGHA